LIPTAITLDSVAMLLANSQAAFEQTQQPATYASGALPSTSLVVTIGQPAVVVIDLPAPLYRMNNAEREAMERAFWRSVVVVDAGSED
jgi:hypothetical protein